MSAGATALQRSLARETVGVDPLDFTPTPLPVARAICELEAWPARVWEPSCGDGAISGEFFRRGYDVVETDIAPRGCGTRLDFLTCRELLAPAIVMNPPYNRANEFVEHALDLGAEKVLALLELGWLQAVEPPRRVALLEHRGLARVRVSARRIPFKRGGWNAGNGGGSMRKHAFFIWERGFTGDWAGSRFDWEDFI